MNKYRVLAEMTTTCYIDIDAENEESAINQANQTDPVCFMQFDDKFDDDFCVKQEATKVEGESA